MMSAVGRPEEIPPIESAIVLPPKLFSITIIDIEEVVIKCK